jgi:cytochrome c-type biogenesis protein CcmH
VTYAAVAGAVVFGLFAARAAAQSPAQSDSVIEATTTAIAVQLRCPVCQGESIQDSPSELARQMRNLVRDQLRAGKSPNDVKAYFVSRYGEWILLQPRAAGFNLLIYVVPALAVLGGLALIVFAVRRWTRPPETPA